MINYEESIQLRREIIRTDVTAVKIINNFIFAGIGNVLHIFDVFSDKCYQYFITTRHRIHGIVITDCKNLLAVYGNRELVISSIYFTDTEVSLTPINRWFVDDWIWDVKWYVDTTEISVLTANNVITVWNWNIKSISEQVICKNKCLLYCGIILGNDLDTTVIIGGSMFKTILIWAPSKAIDGKCIAMHKLLGHKGAIFSVFYHRDLHQICSTSDDRSVKIWCVCFPTDNESIIDSWSKAKIFLVLTVFGHMSRVWKSVILDDARFISAGEDGQLRIWNADGTSIYHWETHQGASIRCLDINDKLNIIVTGSKDCGLSKWPLSANYAYQNNKSSEIVFSDSFNIRSLQDVPRRILLTSSGKFVTVTNTGMVLLYSNHQWNCVTDDHNFASYCLFEITPSRRFISLAGIAGHIKILEECEGNILMRVKFDGKICMGKIFSFHWLSENHFITCCSDGKLEIWHLRFDQTLKIYFVNKVNNFILPLCKERWLTSAIQLNHCIIVGDRDGSVHLFDNDIFPKKTFRRIHGKLGVSYIWSNNDNECFSIGRDGFVRLWNVTEAIVEHIAANKLPLKWPVRFIESPLHDLLVIGFNEVNFEVWNVKERKQLLSLKCGGGHRPWDFIIEKIVQFVYIKEKIIHNIMLPLDQLVNHSYLGGFHTREIDCVLSLNENLIISGGEDTTLRISMLDRINNSFVSVSIIYSHISSVRAISFLNIDNYFLIASAGGRAQLKVWKIFINEKNDVKYNECDSHMLKYTSKYKKPCKDIVYNFELEPRHMDLQIQRKNNETDVYIYVAGSDAFWRIYLFNLMTKTLKLIQEIEYPGYCILKILFVNWMHQEFIVTMATDGKVTFWELKSYTVLYQQSIHQSGINSYDFVITNNNCLLLATGGDDATLSLSLFKFESNKIAIINQCQNSSIYEAQISGIRIMKNFIITAGADQKVVLWKWEITSFNQIQVEFISLYHSFVPDIHGLVITSYTRNEICVYGVGFEIFTVKF